MSTNCTHCGQLVTGRASLQGVHATCEQVARTRDAQATIAFIGQTPRRTKDVMISLLAWGALWVLALMG